MKNIYVISPYNNIQEQKILNKIKKILQIKYANIEYTIYTSQDFASEIINNKFRMNDCFLGKKNIEKILNADIIYILDYGYSSSVEIAWQMGFAEGLKTKNKKVIHIPIGENFFEKPIDISIAM